MQEAGGGRGARARAGQSLVAHERIETGPRTYLLAKEVAGGFVEGSSSRAQSSLARRDARAQGRCSLDEGACERHGAVERAGTGGRERAECDRAMRREAEFHNLPSSRGSLGLNQLFTARSNDDIIA